MEKAIVIGSGVGGLATAARLASTGYQVTVFEAQDGPGGKLMQFEKDGFRFDWGPSVFTLPGLIEDIIRAAGKDPDDYFTYSRLESTCKYFYGDGTIVNGYSDAHRFAEEVEEKLGVASSVVLDFLDHSAEMNKHTTPVFLESSLHKLSTYTKSSTVRAFAKLPGFDVDKTMHQANERRLRHPKLVQLFDRFATYNGSNPYRAPGILNVIPSLEHIEGAYFPDGGMYSITRALYQLNLDLGVEFHFNTPVDRILVEDRRAVGVEDRGSIRYTADTVVSNMDVYHTYKSLMPGQKEPRRILKQERSSSALVFYWGIASSFDELELHNILFSEDYENEFDALFKRRTIDPDPTVYINITSKKNPSDAPDGMENWFVMINAPHDSGQDWDALIATTRRHVIDKLSKALGRNIEELIVSETVTDPRRIASKTLSYTGALYGTSSNDRMAAFLRHPNFTNRIKGLYFCGGSVHPGGGIPLCLLSAKIIQDLVA